MPEIYRMNSLIRFGNGLRSNHVSLAAPFCCAECPPDFVANHSNIQFAIICPIQWIQHYCSKSTNSVGGIRTFFDCSIAICGLLSNSEFVTPVYAVFRRCDKGLPLQLHHCNELIADILRRNDVLTQYLGERPHSLESIALASMRDADQAMNSVIVNADGIPLISDELEAAIMCHQTKKIPQYLMLYHQLVHPLTSWDGYGGGGLPISDDSHGAMELIRKTLI
jgi:hypothetical protein